MKPFQAQVNMVFHSPAPEQRLATAAKLCYSADTEILFEQDPASAGKFVKMRREPGHWIPA
jgi:hypothetical protein